MEIYHITTVEPPGTGLVWAMVNGADPYELGFIVEFLSNDDPAPAAEQLDKSYAHGGGWRPISGFKLGGVVGMRSIVSGAAKLLFPGDPPYGVRGFTILHSDDESDEATGELVVLFDRELMMIMQPDGSYEVARID